jgi:hypothetical protein
VTAGSSVGAINVTLLPGGSISGTVTNAAGAGLPKIQVQVATATLGDAFRASQRQP